MPSGCAIIKQIAHIKNISIAIMNNTEIGPVIARGIIFLFGHLFLMPFTKLTMAMIKHGIKINTIAQIMIIMAIHTRIPKIPTRIVNNAAPINPILMLYNFNEFIAIILKHPNIIRSFANNDNSYDYRNNDKWGKQSSCPFMLNALN